jgi:hypothetical protein
MKILLIIPSFFLEKKSQETKTNSKEISKNHHNCLQYERLLQILHFHILDISKFDNNIMTM